MDVVDRAGTSYTQQNNKCTNNHYTPFPFNYNTLQSVYHKDSYFTLPISHWSPWPNASPSRVARVSLHRCSRDSQHSARLPPKHSLPCSLMGKVHFLLGLPLCWSHVARHVVPMCSTSLTDCSGERLLNDSFWSSFSNDLISNRRKIEQLFGGQFRLVS